MFTPKPTSLLAALAAACALPAMVPAIADVITVTGYEEAMPFAPPAMPGALDSPDALMALADAPMRMNALLAQSFEDARIALADLDAYSARVVVDRPVPALLDDTVRALGGRDALLIPIGSNRYGAFIGGEGREPAFRARLSAVLGEGFAPASAYGEEGSLLFLAPDGGAAMATLFPISPEVLAQAEADPVARTVDADAARAMLAGLGLPMPDGARDFHLVRAEAGARSLSFGAASSPADIEAMMVRELGKAGTFRVGLDNGHMVQSWRDDGVLTILAMDGTGGADTTVVVQTTGATR